jgi:transposase
MQLTLSAPKIWFYHGAVDFRKSIDGLVNLIQSTSELNPAEGIFIFHNRPRDKLKLLSWHGNGFVLLYKRLERNKFTVLSSPEETVVALNEKQLSWLLAGLHWEQMSQWNTLAYDDYY